MLKYEKHKSIISATPPPPREVYVLYIVIDKVEEEIKRHYLAKE